MCRFRAGEEPAYDALDAVGSESLVEDFCVAASALVDPDGQVWPGDGRLRRASLGYLRAMQEGPAATVRAAIAHHLLASERGKRGQRREGGAAALAAAAAAPPDEDDLAKTPSLLRLLQYPPNGSGALSAHTDFEVFTFIHQRRRGLQIQHQGPRSEEERAPSEDGERWQFARAAPADEEVSLSPPPRLPRARARKPSRNYSPAKSRAPHSLSLSRSSCSRATRSSSGRTAACAPRATACASTRSSTPRASRGVSLKEGTREKSSLRARPTPSKAHASTNTMTNLVEEEDLEKEDARERLFWHERSRRPSLGLCAVLSLSQRGASAAARVDRALSRRARRGPARAAAALARARGSAVRGFRGGARRVRRAPRRRGPSHATQTPPHQGRGGRSQRHRRRHHCQTPKAHIGPLPREIFMKRSSTRALQGAPSLVIERHSLRALCLPDLTQSLSFNSFTYGLFYFNFVAF